MWWNIREILKYNKDELIALISHFKWIKDRKHLQTHGQYYKSVILLVSSTMLVQKIRIHVVIFFIHYT